MLRCSRCCQLLPQPLPSTFRPGWLCSPHQVADADAVKQASTAAFEALSAGRGGSSGGAGGEPSLEAVRRALELMSKPIKGGATCSVAAAVRKC